MKKIYSLLTIIIILLSLSITYTIQTSPQKNKLEKNDQLLSTNTLQMSEQNTNITINGNQDFSYQAQKNGWSGSGTQNNPFIIENLLFNASIPSQYQSDIMLSIYNVSSFFTVQNNYFYGNLSVFTAMRIFYCQNAIIKDNGFYTINNGLIIQNSKNIEIQNNIFNNSQLALDVAMSSNINTISNSFTTTGINNFNIFDYYATNTSEIMNNRFNSSYINFYEDIGIIFTSNTCLYPNFYIDSSKVVLSYNIIEKALSTRSSVINIGIQADNASYFKDAYGSIIEHNLIENTTFGIIFNPATLIHVSPTSCSDYLECSEVPVNYSGPIILHYTDYTVRYNEFINNHFGAIQINHNCDNNTIYGNDFINNNQSTFNTPNPLNNPNQKTNQVYESPVQNVSNHWSYNGVGNYWSDYNYPTNSTNGVGQVPMKIPANDSDPFPKVNSINNAYNYSLTSSIQSNSNDLTPVIVILSVIVVIAVITVVFIEKRKHKKLSTKKNMKQNSFQKNLVKKGPFNKQKEQQEGPLSNETLDALEKIIDENKEA